MDAQEVEKHLSEMKEADKAPSATIEERVADYEEKQAAKGFEPAETASEPAAKEAPEPPKEPQVVPVAVHMRQREKWEREKAELQAQFLRGQQRLEEIAARLRTQQVMIARRTVAKYRAEDNIPSANQRKRFF